MSVHSVFKVKTEVKGYKYGTMCVWPLKKLLIITREK